MAADDRRKVAFELSVEGGPAATFLRETDRLSQQPDWRFRRTQDRHRLRITFDDDLGAG